ncbi:AraC family transcriptional regulator [Marinobacter sp. SS13-12]|uniref:helix-turn-helix transcriptional regulator n=1 Tax=Marinobacter sp. SS13-12 TaxID=3050451 RepID=UPI00255596AC|nr:AraC family transcriptional regulator [Marinobacter sp. SS13-12]MDK8463043.1 AraC family transcriptional regulator [Marinobacter sp. SS13-12]
MYFCKSQRFLLEHFLRIDTSRPEGWLSALQILTTSPRLSRKILSPKNRGEFRARLSSLQSDNLSVLGCYLRNPSMISGVNAGFATIVMPVEGQVDFKVLGNHYLCGPWMPFLLEPDEDFHATLSEETHILIIQLPCLTVSGERPSFRRRRGPLVELIAAFLFETPFFCDYKHAQSRLEQFSAELYEFTESDRALPTELDHRKQVRSDRRLCSAIQLMNDELDTDIDIESIASRSGLSLRNLHYLMRQYIGQSPYQYLRGRRLIKARESIIRNYPENISIAQHALNSGFQHTGRFSGYYEKHFGEYPSQTLSTLDHLKQLSGKVRASRDGDGNTRQQWLTSFARSTTDRVRTNAALNEQEP